MTDDERALLHGLEERIEILQNALLKAFTVTDAKLTVQRQRINQVIEVVNDHTFKLEQILEAMSSYEKPIEDDDDGGYIN
jgi:hypothetical protein